MEKKIKAYLIDDEEAPRKLMRYLIGRHIPKVEIVGEANSLMGGVEEIKSMKIDVLFLDIEMPNHKGTEVLKFLPRPIDFEIVFVTAYNDYAISAFKLSAFDYLLKPLQLDELKDTVNRLTNKRADQEGHNTEQIELLSNNLSSNNKSYCLRTHKEEYVIPIDSIYYLEADGMYTLIYLEDDQITASKPLKDILADLPECFVRTHRSFAVNLMNVQSPLCFTGNNLLLNKGFSVPLSSRKKEDLISSFDHFVAQK